MLLMEDNGSQGCDVEESDPVVTLKTGVNIDDLLSSNGMEFEVNLSDIESSADKVNQFDSSNVYKFYKDDILDSEDENEDDDDSKSMFEKMAAKMESLAPDRGVMKQMLQQGTGDLVPPGAHVIVHYNAYLEYADEPFDSTRLRGTPSSFDLGSGQVLPGFDVAVSSMRKKELSRFLIAPSYALGKTGCPPRIPGDSTFVLHHLNQALYMLFHVLYVIELVSFVDVGGAGEYFSLPISERNDAPFELVLKAVKKTKQEAKSHFETKRYHPAISAYRKAVNILDNYHLKNEEEEGKQQQILLQLYQNLALCNLKVGQCGRVIQNANEALRIDPNSYKALYLKGKALRQQGEFDRAKVELMKAHSLYPKSKEITEELQKVEKSSKLFQLDEKKMYQRMFPQPENKDRKESPEADADQTATSSDSQVDEISRIFSEKLQMFVDDAELMEIPYSTASHTPQELDSLEAVAKKMGLLVLRKQQGSTVHIRICKHKS